MIDRRIFYVDSAEGEDTNSGLSVREAWKSLLPVNHLLLAPGDRICLKKGSIWMGTLEPKGNGGRWNPVVIEAYGEGEAPLIDGNGAYAAIYLRGVSYYIIDGIRIKNTAIDRNVRQGICICGNPEGITKDIVVRNCEISMVCGENRRSRDVYKSMYWNGGIYVTMPGRSSFENHLHDIIIEKNYIHDVYTSGIRINQEEDFINDIHHTHIVVRSNRIERTGSDGIIVANCISPLIDGNVCIEAGALGNLSDTQLIAGIWVCATSNALIQRNEVAKTKLFENDGTAFDTDWGTAGDTIFQYNYSHDNEGGFWLNCMKLSYNKDCRGTILRYNVSLRDGRGIGVYDQGVPVKIYGNLFVGDESSMICVFGNGENYEISNNVLLFGDGPKKGWQFAKYKRNWYGEIKVLPKDESPLSKETFDFAKFIEGEAEGRDWLAEKWDTLCTLLKNN